jgi:hypothetical protein
MITRTIKRAGAAPLCVLLAITPGLVALGLCCYQLAQPDALYGLQGSDDGIWLAPAIRLVHGALPFRDYAWVHPPGIALLMALVGLLGDPREALVAARVLTALVVGLNASLAAIAVRSRGPVAMLAGGFGLAIFPQTVSVGHTVSLDVYLVVFCLLGAIVMFRGGSLASPRRLGLAGALFGLAIAMKAWGVFPAIAGLLICLPLWRSAVLPFASGLALGFGLPSLPFFIAAPSAFVHDVVFSQLIRSTTGQGFTSFGERLQLLLGFAPSQDPTDTYVALAIAGVLAILIAATYAFTARSSKRLDWFVLGAAALVAWVMLFVVKEVYSYYAYFVVSFGVLLLAICISRVVDGLRWAGERIGGSARRAGKIAGTVGVPAVIVIAAVLLLPGDITYANTFVSGAYDPEPTVASQVPAGACVVFDEAGILIDSNRFPSSKAGCPDIADAFGLWLTDNNGIPPPGQPSDTFVAEWQSWLEQADYVVLSVPRSDYLPWTPSLTSWFNANYSLVASQPHVYVYRRTAQASDLVTQGLKAELSGDLLAAENDYLEAIQLDRNNLLAHYDLGTIYDKQGKKAEAVHEYQTAVSLGPNFAQALFNLAVDTASSDPHGAEALYRHVVSLQPTWATAWLNLGFVLQSEGKFGEAKADWAKAILLDASLASRIPGGAPG